MGYLLLCKQTRKSNTKEDTESKISDKIEKTKPKRQRKEEKEKIKPKKDKKEKKEKNGKAEKTEKIETREEKPIKKKKKKCKFVDSNGSSSYKPCSSKGTSNGVKRIKFRVFPAQNSRSSHKRSLH